MFTLLVIGWSLIGLLFVVAVADFIRLNVGRRRRLRDWCWPTENDNRSRMGRGLTGD